MRIEDTAYCLLGLFNVNMPLLYGERHKAFIRLQLEIIRMSYDESTFAWTQDVPSSGFFATSPFAFKDSVNIIGLTAHDNISQPYQMTNRGLAIQLVPKPFDGELCSICRKMDPNNPNPTRGCRTVQLACGSLSNPQASVRLEPLSERTAQESPVIITLHKLGTVWQKVDCRRLEFRGRVSTIQEDEGEGYNNSDTQLLVEKFSTYALYYIPQLEY